MGKEPINYVPIDKALKQQALDKLAKAPYRTNRQIAEANGVSTSSVEKRKKLLAKAQVMQEAADICRNDERGTKKRPKGTRGNASPFHDALQRAAAGGDAEDFFQTYADHRVLTPEESMRLMSGLACDPNIPPQVRTSADAQLDKLRVRHAPKESLGPGPPLTSKDKFSRLLAVIEACPPAVLEQAFATLEFPTPLECDERSLSVSLGARIIGSVPTFDGDGEVIVTDPSRESTDNPGPSRCPNCRILRSWDPIHHDWVHPSIESLNRCVDLERGSPSSPKPVDGEDS